MAHMQQMLCSSGYKVTVSGENVTALSTALIIFRSDGTVDRNIDGVVTQVDTDFDWVRPLSAVVNPFEIRATLSSGSTPGTGTLDTWLSLDSDQSFGWTAATGTATLLIEIRIGEAVLDSGTYVLTSEP
jgi:hypothetical protein